MPQPNRDNTIIARPARHRRAFTLVELLVAIAAVALLTVGIGQIFTSVGRLVGSGAALAETDQFARAVEQQIRSDFAALGRMRAEDTFIAIRNRKLGDFDSSNTLNGPEKAIYLTADDRDADRRNGIDPYARGSRAVTVRLDEIIFITSADGENSTAQRLPPSGASPGDADYMRIYYGHGLRPPLVRGFDPRTDPPVAWMSNVPPRMWFPDGDFGDRAGINNRYAPGGVSGAFSQTQGRNELAGEWLLLRQPLFLSGGLAAGYTTQFTARLPLWTYSPFIRGHECVERAWSGFGINVPMDDLDNATPRPAIGWPFPRVLYHGRTDLCAQGLPQVRRWLEGLDPAANPLVWPDASAFDGGRLDDPLFSPASRWDPVRFSDGFPSNKIDAPLWQRFSGANNLEFNHQRLISAIAGCFARFQADDLPPLLDRGDSLRSGGTPFLIPPNTNIPPRALAFMDTHAIIAGRVSSFEVAWSDGKRWDYDQPYDRNRDGDTNDPDDLHRGDIIWYDIDFTRYPGPGNRNLRHADINNIYQTASDTATQATWPEVFPGERRTMLDVNLADRGRYDPFTTGADPDPDGSSEYLAVFPYRQLNGPSTLPPNLPDGAHYGDPFPKPTQIRFRMTVHDKQFRIPGGRQHEIIVSVDVK